jgi:hypothetical protein
MQLAPDRFAHRAACAIAADDVARPDRLDLALVRGIDAFEAHGHGMIGDGIDMEIKDASAVIRFELGRRSAHDVEETVMDARLVEDDVREFRQPVLDVLNPAAAGDPLRRPLIRPPERRFR